MKQRIIYIGIAAIIGLAIGYLIFGGSGDNMEGVTTHDHAKESENQMWTCSMHPQIMQPEPGDCPICGMDLIPAETGADGLTPEQFAMTDNALALANIQTTVVGVAASGIDNTLTLSGKIAVNREAIAVQASYFDGRIERLHANYEGQEVRKGQLLASIYSPELVAAQQELLTAASIKESQPQLYEAVRKKMKLWKLSDDQINSIESSGNVTEYFPVYATVSGTITEVMSAEGDYVKKGQPIAKVSDLTRVWADFDAYESHLSIFKKGQKISISTKAYPNRTFDGKITFIDPILDNATRTVTIRATIENKEKLFKPGMFVTGRIETGAFSTGESKLLAPSSAVMWTGERSLVYVKVDPDKPIFEMREVMLGARIGELIEVTSGLDAGEEIVTNGTFTVDAAAQLQGKKSMMNKEGGKTSTGHEGHMNMPIDHRSGEHGGDGVGAADREMAIPSEYKEKLKSLLDNYIKIKDKLVNDEFQAAASSLKDFQKALEGILSDQPEQLPQADKWKALSKDMEVSARDLSKAGNLKDFRRKFKEFSALMTETVKIFDIGARVYSQYCPMADNNQGAFWLSYDEEIRNPYFGDKMLRCGSVTATF